MKRFLGTAIAGALSIFFVAIMCIVMFVMVKIHESVNGAAAITFVVIESIILITVIGGGKLIMKVIGNASYAIVCTFTIIYGILGAAVTLIFFSWASGALYIVVKLVLLLAFLCVVLPISLIRSKTTSEENTKPQVNYHNLDLNTDAYAQDPVANTVPVKTKTFCPNCGGSIKNGMQFCSSCGYKIE